MKDISYVNGIKTFVGKQKFKKWPFVYQQVGKKTKINSCKLVLIWIKIINKVFQAWVAPKV